MNGGFSQKKLEPGIPTKNKKPHHGEGGGDSFCYLKGHWWLGKDSCQGREFLFFPKC